MLGQVRIPLHGCDCYAYGLLAAGFCDLVVEADMKPYDYLALVPIVEGAGGVMTDWKVRGSQPSTSLYIMLEVLYTSAEPYQPHVWTLAAVPRLSLQYSLRIAWTGLLPGCRGIS